VLGSIFSFFIYLATWAINPEYKNTCRGHPHSSGTHLYGQAASCSCCLSVLFDLSPAPQ
jgi:hypothetical protein